MLTGGEYSEELLLLLGGYATEAVCLAVVGATHSGAVESLGEGVSDLYYVKEGSGERLEGYIAFTECDELTELTFGDVRGTQPRRW